MRNGRRPTRNFFCVKSASSPRESALVDLSRIKQFVKQNGDKFIVVENEEPELVVMSFKEYENIMFSRNGNGARDAGRKKFQEHSFSPPAVDISQNGIMRVSHDAAPAGAVSVEKLAEKKESPDSYFHPWHSAGISDEESEVVVEGGGIDAVLQEEIRPLPYELPARSERVRLEDLPI